MCEKPDIKLNLVDSPAKLAFRHYIRNAYNFLSLIRSNRNSVKLYRSLLLESVDMIFVGSYFFGKHSRGY